MPIFNFKCKKCGKEFEYLVLNEKEKVICNYCKTKNNQKKTKIFKPTNFSAQYKGDGFFTTEKKRDSGLYFGKDDFSN